MTQGSHAAEIKVFATGASRSAYQTLAPQFERDTGHKLVTEFDLPPALVRKIDAGEPYDVIILSYDVEALIKQGKVAANSRTAFGKIGVGIAVHRGSPKPDFSTVEAFKRSMLDAKLIATSGEGSSGRYVASLIERLGIAEQIKPKIRSAPAAHQRNWCREARWISWCQDCRHWWAFPMSSGSATFLKRSIAGSYSVAGLRVNAKQPDAGRALLKFLTTPAAMAVWKANGLEPP